MRRLSPLQDALLLAVAVLIIAVILLITVLFPPPARSDQPTVPTPLPSSAFTPVVVTPDATATTAPETPPAAPTSRIVPEPVRTSSASAPSPTRLAGSPTLSGLATWYAWRPGEAAAGPGLRTALGSGWRGDTVAVCVETRCVTVRLTDWCACPGGRLVDLDSRSFAALAPLSVGVLKVRVSPAD